MRSSPPILSTTVYKEDEIKSIAKIVKITMLFCLAPIAVKQDWRKTKTPLG